ncbi:MAG: hypothetical protein ABI778_08765 [Ignavibacteriota bacterium]
MRRARILRHRAGIAPSGTAAERIVEADEGAQRPSPGAEITPAPSQVNSSDVECFFEDDTLRVELENNVPKFYGTWPVGGRFRTNGCDQIIDVENDEGDNP